LDISKKSINELIKESYETAKEKGWHDQERSFGEIISLIHSELSEAFEEYRKHGNKKGHMTCIYYSGKGYVSEQPTETCKKPEGIPIELTDVLIRIFDFCGKHNIDLEEALEIKMEFNKTRPYRHGGKVV